MTFHEFQYIASRTFSDLRAIGIKRLKCELLGCNPDPKVEYNEDDRIASLCLHCGEATDGPNHWDATGLLPYLAEQWARRPNFRWQCWCFGCESPEFPPDYLEPESMQREYIGCVRCWEVEGAMFEYFLPKNIWSRISIALRHNWIHKRCRECPTHVWFTNDDFCHKARAEARLHELCDKDCPF